MITYEEMVKKLFTARSDALNGKRSMLIEQVNNDSEIAYYQKVLFGSGGVRGILGVMETSYAAIRNSSGSVSSKPSDMHNVASSSSLWISRFSQAITTAGDGDGGFYPPDPANTTIAVDTYNKACDWVVSHGMSAESNYTSSVFYFLDKIKDTVGYAATDVANLRGSYQTLAEAQSAASSSSSTGKGILGVRTKNVEINGVAAPYSIGMSGPDDKDAYSSAGKSVLENYLSQVITALGTYRASVLVLKTALTEPNAILTEAKVVRPSDVSSLDSVVTSIDSITADIQSMLNYLTPITETGDSNRDEFSAKLNTLLGYTTSHKTTIRGHISTFNTLIGTSDASNLRQGLALWVKLLLAKPSGPWIEKSAIAAGIAQSVKEISVADDSLSGVQGTEVGMLEKPTMDSIYSDPLTNEAGETLEQRLTMEWTAPSCCNKYKILRKLYNPGDAITNDSWSSGFTEFWQTAINSDSGEIEASFTQTPPDGIFLYRVVGYDSLDGAASSLDRMDSFNSNTPQSDILGTSYNVTAGTPTKATFAAGSNMTKIFASGQLVLTNAGIKQIDEVAETIISFIDDGGTVSITFVQKLFGAGTLSEAE